MSLYVWGSNKSHQLPGITEPICYTPKLIDNLHIEACPIDIACGEQHSLLLLDSGEILAFGHGKDGQLGHGNKSDANEYGVKVKGLEDEEVIAITASANSSFAVTSSGSLYNWGLVLVDNQQRVVSNEENLHEDEEEDEFERTQAGELHGMARDRNTIVVNIDHAARQEAQQPMQDTNNPRLLNEIVEDSTMRWMLPTADADQEYYRELRAMGYAVDEADERMQERGREYHGMLRMGCRRIPRLLPTKVLGLDGIRVMTVSSGYAHVMAISDQGYLYAAGYNDRGQLGLGHRINTSVFKPVDFLANKFVLQVSCGQQHTLCRVIDRKSLSHQSHSHLVGSKQGGDVYIWGNGMLGQLGLGRKGTSKGRLLPTLLTSIQETHPQGIIDISAGANFSVLVTSEGLVYSFGHAEYNQHGTGHLSHADYIDAFYFYLPRVVPFHQIVNKHGQTPVITSVSCGNTFTIALDNEHNVYSWGWNEGGVLGQGQSSYSSIPTLIPTLSHTITHLCTGNKHILALSHLHQTTFNPMIYRALHSANHRYYDCELIVCDGKTQELRSFFCHKAILAQQSRYLYGYIHAAYEAQQSPKILRLEFLDIALSQLFTPIIIKGFIDFIYGHHYTLPFQQQKYFYALLMDWQILVLPLSPISSPSIISPITPFPNISPNNSSLPAKISLIPQQCSTNQIKQQLQQHQMKVHHLFSLFNNVMMFPDLVFVYSSPTSSTSSTVYKLYAHQFIISKIPYFCSYLQESFQETSIIYEELSSPNDDTLIHMTTTSRKAYHCIDITPLLLNLGLHTSEPQETLSHEIFSVKETEKEETDASFLLFQRVIMFIYTGQCCLNWEEIETEIIFTFDEMMIMLVLGCLIDYLLLIHYAERYLMTHMTSYSNEQIVQCLEYAQGYHLIRLEKQCLRYLDQQLCSSDKCEV